MTGNKTLGPADFCSDCSGPEAVVLLLGSKDLDFWVLHVLEQGLHSLPLGCQLLGIALFCCLRKLSPVEMESTACLSHRISCGDKGMSSTSASEYTELFIFWQSGGKPGYRFYLPTFPLLLFCTGKLNCLGGPSHFGHSQFCQEPGLGSPT